MPLTTRTAAVRAGTLCYWCRKHPPTHVDEFGARCCQHCEDLLRALRLKYVEADGYRLSRKGRMN